MIDTVRMTRCFLGLVALATLSVFPALAPAQDGEVPIGLSGYWRASILRGNQIDDAVMSLLKIEDSGTVGGHGGCNRIFGPLRLEDRGIKIGPLSVTRKACPPKVLDQEQTFLRVLRETRDFKHLPDEKTLLLLDGQGVEIGRFTAIQ
ncbi:META domain-containing protein [Roseibium sp.]|uniref:META domain-containing protein n=1 Tax=Roseibium sp. TaxID=1936156 RepID=UPI003A975FB3